MIRLKELFDVETGKDLIYSRLSPGEFNVIGQSTQNNGIVCNTNYLDGYKLYKKEEVITVATYGTLYATVQLKDFYIGTRVKALLPKMKMSVNILKYYALCINANRNNFSYGRVGGERLQDILIPSLDEIPNWVDEVNAPNYKDRIKKIIKGMQGTIIKDIDKSFQKKDKLIKLSELFDISYGTSLELNKLEKDIKGINFVSRTAKNNGVSEKVKYVDGIQPIQKDTITVAVSGSILEAFLQKEEYYTGYHVMILKEKFCLTDIEKLYYCTCIRTNKEKYSYGRQANKTLKDLLVPSPSEIPSWIYQI